MPRLVVLLTPDYADWEFGMLAAPARSYCGIEVLAASPDGEPVSSMGGLISAVDIAFADIDLRETHALAVVGGMSWSHDPMPDISELLRAARWDGRLIASICGGNRALAAAGLLDRVQHTSNAASDFDAIAAYTGHDFYRPANSALRAGNIITAPGTAPVSFMKKVIEGLGRGGSELDHFASLFAYEHEMCAMAAA